MTLWTKHMIAILTAEWGKRSATKIGLLLGVTKSSVVGKAHRLGLRDLGNPVGGGAAASSAREPYKRHKGSTGPRGRPRRADYAPSALKAAAARQDDAFIARIGAALASKQAGVSGAIASSTKQRNLTVFGSPARPADTSPNAKSDLVPAVPTKTLARVDSVFARDISPSVPHPGTRSVRFADLHDHGCKWPVTPHNAACSDTRFCNALRTVGRPYCEEHAEKATGRAAQNIEGLVA